MGDSERQRFWLEVTGTCEVCRPVDLRLHYRAGEQGFQSGGNLWVFYDFRQFLTGQQEFRENGITVSGPAGTEWSAQPLVNGRIVRNLEMHPQVPEFLHAVHMRCTAGALKAGEQLTIRLFTHPQGFLLPQNAIDAFYFWLVEDPKGTLTFHQPEGDKYHYFLPREVPIVLLQSNPLSIRAGTPALLRVTVASLAEREVKVRGILTDERGNPADVPDRQAVVASGAGKVTLPLAKLLDHGTMLPVKGPTDRIAVKAGPWQASSNPVRVVGAQPSLNLYWGELHGMMFNQRPVSAFFEWAMAVAHLDFAGGQYFSYTACITEVWEHLCRTWQDFDLPGTFVALPSVEFGTPPDGSHRHGFFPKVDGLLPIFCEDRAAAHDPRLQAKFHPQTTFCKDYREFYQAVRARGGFTHGHFHTHFYEQETLAEVYQKQQFDIEAEEAKINRFLQQRVKLGIVGGSDTHDSRPANPYPEPGPTRPAGLTGVWAERLDRPTLFAALAQRRCYATTGARILVGFRVNDAWMGSTARARQHAFCAEVLGTAPLERLELVVNGQVAKTLPSSKEHAEWEESVPLPPRQHGTNYCYLRVWQRDGQRAWSSPVWLESPP